MENPTPFADPAAPILSGDPSITDGQRADLWDVFHNSKDADELAHHLQSIAVPDDTKQRLFQAKKNGSPKAEPVDKAVAAINRVGSLDPKILELSEKYPKVTGLLVAAATKEAAGEASEGGAPQGKGKTQAAAKKPTPLVQPPRPDGLEHLPPIPDGHHRVMASDGGIHDIPAENIEKARQIDPRMHVLNP